MKRCIVCHNLNIGKNRQLCNECKSKERFKECNIHISKEPFKVCNFCKFKQVPIMTVNKYQEDKAIFQSIFYMVHTVHIKNGLIENKYLA